MDREHLESVAPEHLSKEEERELLCLAKEVSAVGKTVRASMYFRITSKEKILTYIEHKSTTWRSFFRSLCSRKLAPMYASFALIAFVISSIIPVGILNEAYASQIGRITTEYGVVRVVRGGQEIVVAQGEGLFIGDEVQVEAGGQASLEFIDNSSGILKENSSIAITEVFINPADPENSQVNLALREGNFHVETGKNKGKEGTSLRVDTPSGVVAASQGSFAVVVENSGATEVVAYSSSVTILSKEEGEVSIKEEGGTIALVEIPDGIGILSTPEPSEMQGEEELPAGDSDGTIIVSEQVVGPIVEEHIQQMLSISQVNDLRTKLYFAEIKLQQAATFFEEKKLDQVFLALYDYHERLLEVQEEFLGGRSAFPARGQLTLAALVDYKRSGDMLVQVRSLSVDANALSVYRDALLYLRRMVTLESTLRQQIPVYLANPTTGSIAPDALVYRLAREIAPTVDTLLTLEQERTAASTVDKYSYTPRIEEHIALIATHVMKQKDVLTKKILLEEILKSVPNTTTYSYMVLRFKIHFPVELHGVIDAKAAMMK